MLRARFSLVKIPLATHNLLVNAIEMARGRTAINRLPPGHITVESRERGGRYAYWLRYADGKLVRSYIGVEESEAHRAAIAELAQLKQYQVAARDLRKLGFDSVEHDAALVLVEIFNAGVFAGGGVLIGTRAFGALLNSLGWRASPHLGTRDVDLARPKVLQLASPLPADGFLKLLQNTGLRFAPVMGLERPPGPSTSFKVIGKDLKVDLLVPSRARAKPYQTVPVAELGSHATSLPFLDYLVATPWELLVIGRDHLIPVMGPSPGRYALHKLVVADLRYGTDNPEVEKDLVQAGILAAILTTDGPDELIEAADALTPAMRKHARASLPRWQRLMGEHGSVVEVVRSLIQ